MAFAEIGLQGQPAETLGRLQQGGSIETSLGEGQQVGTEEQGTGIRRPLASDKAQFTLETVEQFGLDRRIVVGGIFEVHRIAEGLQQQKFEASQGQLRGLAIRQRHDGTGIGIEHLGEGGMGFQQVVDQLVEIEAVEEAIAA